MKVRITEDEWFPFYAPSSQDRGSYVVNVTPATLKRWEKAIKVNSKVQDEIRTALENNGYANE